MKKSIYIYNDSTLSRKDNSIRLCLNTGEIKDLPIEQLDEIFYMAQGSINTSILSLLSQHEVTVHFFGWYDNYLGTFLPKKSLLSGRMLIKQAEHYMNEERRVYLAKAFILAATANMYRNLRYYKSRGKDVDQEMKNIQILKESIKNVTSVKELMGKEGNIRKEYYKAWPKIINQDLEFNKRVMNPPDNEINSIISFVNSVIYAKCLSEIYKTQLNPTISYLHEPGERRYSLCLDISEIFKPILGDRIIFRLLNRGQITKDSFDKELNGLHLTQKASKLIMQEIDKTMKITIYHKTLDRDVTYQYLIRLECYKLVKHLLGEKDYVGTELWW